MKTLIFIFLVSCGSTLLAETTYQKPEEAIGKIIRADSFSFPLLNWKKTALIKIYGEELPTLKYVARKQLKLGGARFNPANYTAISNYYYKKLVYFELLSKKTEKQINFPENSIIRHVQWSPDGHHLLVSVEKETCHEVWLVQIPSLKKKPVQGVCLNSILTRNLSWISSNELYLAVRTEKQQGSVQIKAETPTGPVIQQSSGQVSQNRTNPDLLKTAQDEKIFEQALETQLVKYTLSTGKKQKLAKPLLLRSVSLSPNRKLLLVKSIERPFSYVVAVNHFKTRTEIWSLDGVFRKTLSTDGPFENIPIQGVPTGPRNYQWVSNAPQTVFFVQALDGGDWSVKADFRDELFFSKILDYNDIKNDLKTASFIKLKNRFAGIDYFENEDHFLVSDYERDREWVTTYHIHKAKADWVAKVIFSYNENDDYNKPGEAVYIRNQAGSLVVGIDRKKINSFYMSGNGATPTGDRPFLKKINLETFEQEEVFRSVADAYEEFQDFMNDEYSSFLTSYESQTDSPRYLVHTLGHTLQNINLVVASLLYADPNPYKILSEIKKEIITYKRKDGVALSAILYYPLGYKKGKKYPAIIHAYPLEYTDASTAGQVRGSQARFSKPFREDIMYNALRGYIVLDNAQMPIIGHPETKNDTFIEQLVAGAKAAVDTLDQRGLVDRKRLGLSGIAMGPSWWLIC